MALIAFAKAAMYRAPSTSWSYDVFINFRGEDVRRVLAGPLHGVLRENGINAFMDEQGLRKGEEISPTLMTAIQESRTAIVILSENYATSTYCLEELAEIMDQGRWVWPLFYHVTPSDVRKQKGKFGEALDAYETNDRVKHKVKRWRLALQKAADLSGWHVQYEHEAEHELIQKIVEDVSEKISRIGKFKLPRPLKSGRRERHYWRDEEDEGRIAESKKEGFLIFKARAYLYSEIRSITDDFKTIIGRGGSGRVYLGTLYDGTQVAVKLPSLSTNRGYENFQSEVELLKSIHHRNLVSLIGYCDEGDVKALIYEYMDNGDLQKKLSEENPRVLTWKERLHIAIDSAQGLEYLHNDCRPPIIHRNLKPSKILLNANMEAKIADSSISIAFVNDDDSQLSTPVVGTLGYLDPQIFLRQISIKSDIYSFGVILFQLITGQPAIKHVNGERRDMRDWVILEIEKGDIQKIIDERLEGKFSIASVQKAIDVARPCISWEAAQRPDISQVVTELKGCLALDMEITFGHEMGSLQYQSQITDIYPRYEYDSSDVANDPFGLESRVEQTKSLVDVESNDEVHICGETGRITESKKEGSLRNETRAYSYSEIRSITYKNKEIGKGGFGNVFLGTLHDGTKVAVKLLSLSSKQGHKEFQAEVNLLTDVQHENLVSFKGYCNEGVAKALIYEYMENGDLLKQLSERNLNVLKWIQRLQIAVDAAEGLNYLHNGREKPIIHRDLKPSNILLNANMRAKIADFGLSRAFTNEDDTHIVTTGIGAGTDGYRDPLSQINKKSDVYSFGIILFELITGQSVIKKASGEKINMRDYWDSPEFEKEEIKNIVDQRLEGKFSEASAQRAIDAARPCISLEAAKRPDISHVLAELKECLALEITNGTGSLQL